MFQKLSTTTYIQIIFVGLIILISTLLLTGIGYLLAGVIWGESDLKIALSGMTENDAQIGIMKLFQLMSQLSVFVLPPLALAYFIRKDKPDIYCMGKVPDIGQLFAVIVLFVASLPIIQYTLTLNADMHFPESMQHIEQWMIDKEGLAADLTTKFLNTSSWSGLAINLFIMAVMPAIGEELLFRGLLMRWFSKVFSNIHVNIFITSFIFSAIHLQFFGFLPRFLLGLILGYSYYFTRNLWTSIWLHFINNAMTVCVYFWITRTGSNINPEEVGTVDGIGFVLISLVMVITILWWMNKQKKDEIAFIE